ncbi:uncharacterized protein LOC114742538, partial [Neltuma alba]|uniref:uncharacterized protein LOC114742538 n=1 Tax=Neltuma alba TaxID=207710 RepID=UPI0010A30AC8
LLSPFMRNVFVTGCSIHIMHQHISQWMLFADLKRRKSFTTGWKALFTILFCLIWQRRNKLIDAEAGGDMSTVLAGANAIMGCSALTAKRLSEANTGGATTGVINRDGLEMHGKPVVSVDGAHSHAQNRTACGGVLLADDNAIMEGSSFRFEGGNHQAAEPWGCLMGLKRAWEERVRLIG